MCYNISTADLLHIAIVTRAFLICVFFIHTCAKDMQWESSSKLPTVGEGHCPFRMGNLIPSTRTEKNAITVSYTESCKHIRGKKLFLPEEGLLLRGEGGAKVKSGWIGGLLLRGGELNAGKCWRFSIPIWTSGSVEKQELNVDRLICVMYLKNHFQSSDMNCSAAQYLHFPCFLFSSISIRFSLRFSSLAFFCLKRFLFSKSSKDFWGKFLWILYAITVNSNPENRKRF